MSAHPGTIEFIDNLSKTRTTKTIEKLPASIAFAGEAPIVRIVIEAAPDDGRRILGYGIDGALLTMTHMIYREPPQPIRGNKGLTLPPSRFARTRRFSAWVCGWLASSYRTFSHGLAKLKLR